jgi:hypothetical protein
VILSKLSLHELAHVAGTCREFRIECLVRVTDERNRLLSAADERFGEGMVSGFVSAFQNALHMGGGFTPRSLRQRIVTAAGQVEYLTPGGPDMLERCATDGRVGHIWCDHTWHGDINEGVPVWGTPWPECIFSVRLWTNYQGGTHVACKCIRQQGRESHSSHGPSSGDLHQKP